ncbi:MAG: TrbI/VirB10 family protein [Bryobacterales bacterium]|nr:TrbI/VirB10 family protein [Bryobacterales bacterium]
MKLPNLLPNWISNRVADPEGTAPKGFVFKIGVVLFALLMASVIFLAPADETGELTTSAPALPPPAGPSAVAKGDQDIQTAADRRAAAQSRAARRKQQAVDRARQAEERFLREQADLEAEAAENRQAITAARQENLTAEEELYQNLRLERIQREDMSMRSPPVALSFRSNETQARPMLVESDPTPPPGTVPQPPAPSPAQPQSQPTPTREEQALEESNLVVATRRPSSSRGWERIDGGQWIEAVLVTQIRGDAPGPAIARASTPFWSRDRQRILIPRGARFVGRVQAVQGVDQSRLSVTFDRLIFDNHNLRMPFAGLSQAGEAGLKDKVKRHYLATFGAAGAVGVIAGLTLRNTQSTGFNVPAGQAARMEIGRSLGESTSAIMSRYLNRMPTLIIRAGHRIRIYFVSDLYVPRRPA